MIYDLKQIVTLTEKQIERITFCTDFTTTSGNAHFL